MGPVKQLLVFVSVVAVASGRSASQPYSRRCSGAAVALWPPDGLCYLLLTRGPCPLGQWLVRDKQQVDVADCQPLPCANQEPSGLWPPTPTCPTSVPSCPLTHYNLHGELVCDCDFLVGELCDYKTRVVSCCRGEPLQIGEVCRPEGRCPQEDQMLCGRSCLPQEEVCLLDPVLSCGPNCTVRSQPYGAAGGHVACFLTVEDSSFQRLPPSTLAGSDDACKTTEGGECIQRVDSTVQPLGALEKASGGNSTGKGPEFWAQEGR